MTTDKKDILDAIKETCKWESNEGMYRNTGCENSCYEEYDGVLEGYKFCPYCSIAYRGD